MSPFFCAVRERAGPRLFIDHKPHFKTRDKSLTEKQKGDDPDADGPWVVAVTDRKGGEARPYSFTLLGNVSLDIRP